MLESSRLNIIDMHCAGEPVRIMPIDDLLPFPMSVMDARRFLKEERDYLRTITMMEPRGHADMYGALIIESPVDDVDLGAIFIHHSGYSTMCGHATIALGRWLYERDKKNSYVLQCPCGPVKVNVIEDGYSGSCSTSFRSVECFAEALNISERIDGIGEITLDIGYGGAYYAVVSSAELGLNFNSASTTDMRSAAMKITNHLRENRIIRNSAHSDLSFLYGTIVTDGESGSVRVSRNLCVFADGQVDRSPTGSGVSARLAIDFAKGKVSNGQQCNFAGVSGVSFGGKIVDSTDNGVVVEVLGSSFFTGEAELIIEPTDELRNGFAVSECFGAPVPMNKGGFE